MAAVAIKAMSKPRLTWIDWMKSIGMFLIVWGHFMPEYFIDFIYAFNVPVFFIISGFLFRPVNSLKKYFSKNARTLIIPMVLFFILQSLVNIYILGWYKIGGGILEAISGNGFLLGGLWFVYTLLILKTVFNFLHRLPSLLLIMVLLCITANIISRTHGVQIQNSWYNSLTAIPFFYMGFLAGTYWKNKTISFVNFIVSLNLRLKLIITALLLCLTYALSIFNGPVWMYLGQYGDSYALFLLAALTGIGSVFMISVILNDIHKSWNLIISQGTIVILGLHYNAIIFSGIVYPLLGLNQHDTFLSFVSAIAVMAIFIPIIQYISRYFPIAIGRPLNLSL